MNLSLKLGLWREFLNVMRRMTSLGRFPASRILPAPTARGF